MATISKNKPGSGNVASLAFTTLTGTDDFVFNAQQTEVLILRNTTSSDVTVTIDGSEGTTENCPGIGPVDVSSGKALVVTANESESIVLNSISAFLKGTISVSGGTGVEATILVI